MPSKRRKNSRRQHAYHRPKPKPGRFAGSHHCPECGKWCFATRADAEASVRRAFPGQTTRYYRCESADGEWWHFTSMTAAEVAGLKEFRAREAVSREVEWDDGEPKETVALPCD